MRVVLFRALAGLIAATFIVASVASLSVRPIPKFVWPGFFLGGGFAIYALTGRSIFGYLFGWRSAPRRDSGKSDAEV